jgi:protein-tyrosine-phosphatase
VLFVCVHNAGKSQTAAALMRHVGGTNVEVHSAGTDPDAKLSSSAAAALSEIGISTTGEFPKAIDAALFARVDRVVILGSDAQVATVDGMVGSIERWVIAAESNATADGSQRGALVRDEIRIRVNALALELGVAG